ncbi:MAG: hypothetical protein HOH43_17575 [Candidatus Latescibacteria bacterium]|jgi:hypothetical protein|nr:hypothetical protein [Candidatus Latescibacterota bacterium]
MDTELAQPKDMEHGDEQTQAMGLFSRLIGIVFFPGKVFQSVRERPTIWGPILILMIVSASVIPFLTPLNGPMVESQIRSFNPDATEEEIAQASAQAGSTANMVIGAIAAIIMVPIQMLVYTLLYWAIYTVMMGQNASFRSVLSIIAHSQFITIVGTVVVVSLSVYQQELVVSLHLGSLVPFLETDSLVYRILKSIDIFTGLWICLLSIGFGVLFRMTTRTAAMVPLSLWTLWIVVKIVAAEFFGKYLPWL